MYNRRQAPLSLSIMSVLLIGIVSITPQEGRQLPGVDITHDAVLQAQQEEEAEPPSPEIILQEHLVRTGETLWSISRRFGVHPSTLVHVNDLANPNLLFPGQIVLVPPVNEDMHLAGPGESLWQMAASLNSSVDSLTDLDGIDSRYRLHMGEVLAVPVSQPSPTPAGPDLSWPLPLRGKLTSRFGPRWGGFHTGVDIATPSGTRVVASMPGTVSLAGWQGNYGLTVIVDHPGGYQTLYAHLSQVLVSRGQLVGREDILGRVGSTGQSTGPHLHLELRLRGHPIDPLPHLRLPH